MQQFSPKYTWHRGAYDAGKAPEDAEQSKGGGEQVQTQQIHQDYGSQRDEWSFQINLRWNSIKILLHWLFISVIKVHSNGGLLMVLSFKLWSFSEEK